MKSTASLAEQLCLNCGLCCNGVLFKDVELQAGDDAKQFAALGLSLKRPRAVSRGANLKFPQPCTALCADNRCRIYAARPVRCQQFDCALLLDAQAGKVTAHSALRTIRAALRHSGNVLRLLRELDDSDEHLPLGARFRRTKRRLESGPVGALEAGTFGDLTLAMHDLNVLLSRDFLPKPAG